MRILYVHQYFSTPRGATGTRSYEQARLMHEAGHEVTMLTSAAQLRPEELPPGRGLVRRGEIDGVRCIVLDVPYHQRMGYGRRIFSFLRFMIAASRIAVTERRIDLLFATSTPLTVGVPALCARWLRRRPYVFEVRDLWPDVPLGMGILEPGLAAWLLKRAERAIYRGARLIVAVNEDVGERVLQTAGKKIPLVIAPNACDLELFRPDRDGGGFRRRHGIEGKILCVHTGAMGPVNGLDDVLDAAAALRDEERLCFLLIGEGREKGRLRERVEREGLSNVRVLDGVPKTELADVLATADLGLMTVRPIPILELNCANKYFDYLSSGLPIVLNYGGWQARALAEGEAGLSAAQGDLDGFVSAIRRLAGEPELRERMAANARRLAETRFDRRKIVARILEGLDGV